MTISNNVHSALQAGIFQTAVINTHNPTHASIKTIKDISKIIKGYVVEGICEATIVSFYGKQALTSHNAININIQEQPDAEVIEDATSGITQTQTLQNVFPQNIAKQLEKVSPKFLKHLQSTNNTNNTNTISHITQCISYINFKN